MSWNHNNINEPHNESWGGTWTEKKLNAFSKYVRSYLLIMKKNSFWETIYFDGFAGSGSKEKNPDTDYYKQLKITVEEEKTYKGAAERVLTFDEDLSFNYYYFIDKQSSSIEKLKQKLNQKIDLSNKKIAFKAGDANNILLDLAEVMQTQKYAALVLLDPFGMQINWNSIAALQKTRTDIWILIPTGVIVNRLLDKKGELKLEEKLESFFGLTIDEIKANFYKKTTEITLFGEEEVITKVSKPIEKISQLYIDRLKTIWNHVTEKPLVLRNSNKVPIFHFVFASNNSNALKIANQIIKTI